MTSFLGLPAHPLFVHAAVILLPLAAVLVLLYACWPAARARIGLLAPVAGAIAFVSAELAEGAGEALEKIAKTKPGADLHALHEHGDVGTGVVLWATGLFVVSLLAYLAHGGLTGGLRRRAPVLGAGWVRILCAVLAVVAAFGVIVSTVLAGHSGAELVWGKYLG